MTENPWIEWKGEECPVAGETLVQVQFFDDSRETAENSDGDEAACFMWEDGTIRFYRLTGPSA